MTPPPRRASDTLLSPAILQTPSHVLSNRCQTGPVDRAFGPKRWQAMSLACVLECTGDAEPVNPDRWRQIERIYHLALDRPLHEREVVLDSECHGDQRLSLEVDVLLRRTPSSELHGHLYRQFELHRLGRAIGRANARPGDRRPRRRAHLDSNEPWAGCHRCRQEAVPTSQGRQLGLNLDSFSEPN